MIKSDGTRVSQLCLNGSQRCFKSVERLQRNFKGVPRVFQRYFKGTTTTRIFQVILSSFKSV